MTKIAAGILAMTSALMLKPERAALHTPALVEFFGKHYAQELERNYKIAESIGYGEQDEA
jgi:hypothetical protein